MSPADLPVVPAHPNACHAVRARWGAAKAGVVPVTRASGKSRVGARACWRTGTCFDPAIHQAISKINAPTAEPLAAKGLTQETHTSTSTCSPRAPSLELRLSGPDPALLFLPEEDR